MTIQAVQHIRRMRGGAQSHLMRCSDGNFYVVKFQNNPQHPRVLANDWLGTCLAALVGLSVPTPAIVEVHPWLIEHTPELRFEQGSPTYRATAGARIDWSRVGAVLATTAMVWAILQMILEPSSAAKKS